LPKPDHSPICHFVHPKSRAAAATITRQTSRILDAYLARLGIEIAPASPIFRNRSGRAYSKDTLGDDFRDVRTIVFGPHHRRICRKPMRRLLGDGPPSRRGATKGSEQKWVKVGTFQLFAELRIWKDLSTY
jgi:hypothetical protein